jgi:hypothetical protein
LSWVSYDFILLPAMGSLLMSGNTRHRLIGLTGWALWIAPVLAYPFAGVELGVSSLVVRLLLLGCWWLGWISWREAGTDSTWVASSAGTEATIEMVG